MRKRERRVPWCHHTKEEGYNRKKLLAVSLSLRLEEDADLKKVLYSFPFLSSRRSFAEQEEEEEVCVFVFASCSVTRPTTTIRSWPCATPRCNKSNTSSVNYIYSTLSQFSSRLSSSPKSSIRKNSAVLFVFNEKKMPILDSFIVDRNRDYFLQPHTFSKAFRVENVIIIKSYLSLFSDSYRKKETLMQSRSASGLIVAW